MRLSSGQFLCACVAGCLSGRSENGCLPVATMLTLVFYIAVNCIPKRGEPAADPDVMTAPAFAPQH
ncbi:hypothetical protein SM0020_03305 [Sinorhizobium meliloti CCNWSX0020]|uniref:Uncharacterized protein n=1 Tax=Sinorhizobium meliloti CCNWSX0020 TaxID=1107881 RepID=H0FU36_RHIML|nr:hypothetical protein [Sinorhizobium meliloti]EHK79367.1 hypothetical protein SM0020_03305 [Sinorhizobium meliloti CCNWSX0020]RVG66116.1 hypothetical protein CN220_23680 [Sinorhizobium meliloti]